MTRCTRSMHSFFSNLRYTDEFVRSPNESGSWTRPGRHKANWFGFGTHQHLLYTASQNVQPYPYPEPTGRSIPPIHTKTQVVQTDPYVQRPNFDATPVYLSISPSLRLSTSPSIHLSIYSSIHLFIYSSIYSSICSSIYHIFIHLCIYTSMHLGI